MSVSRPVVFAKINLQQAVFKQDTFLHFLRSPAGGGVGLYFRWSGPGALSAGGFVER